MNKTLLKSLLLTLLVAGFTQAQSTTFDFDDAAASGNIYDGARATGYTFTESGIEFNFSADEPTQYGLLYYNPGILNGVTGFLYGEAQTSPVALYRDHPPARAGVAACCKFLRQAPNPIPFARQR